MFDFGDFLKMRHLEEFSNNVSYKQLFCDDPRIFFSSGHFSTCQDEIDPFLSLTEFGNL